MMKMIRRSLYFILPLAVAAILGIAFFRPGTVQVMWNGSVYETSLFFMLSTLLAIVFLGQMFARLMGFAINVPRWVRASWRHRLQKKALLTLKIFIGERFQPGECYDEMHTLMPLLKIDALEDIGQFLLGKTVTPVIHDMPQSPLALQFLCDKAQRRGQWEHVLTLVQKARELSLPMTWAFWGGAKAYVHRLEMDAALRFVQESYWDTVLTPAEQQIATGAILLERVLQQTPGNVDFPALQKQAKKLPYFWPLSLYVAQHHPNLSPRAGLKLFENCWEASPHLGILTGYLKSLSRGCSIDVLNKTIAHWWTNLASKQPGESLLYQAYVLAHAGVWGQALNRLDESLKSMPSREGYLLAYHIHKRGFSHDRDAASALFHALEKPVLLHHDDIVRTLLPLSDAIPHTMQFIQAHTAQEALFVFKP